jgi:hypothetical protein
MNHSYTAFQNSKRVAKGPLEEIALKLKKRYEDDQTATFLVFDDQSGRTLEFLDFSGTNEQVLQRIQVYLPREESKSSGPGRPKLGVVAREVSLLPRHWEWLAQQPGGASVTLRKLVEEKAKGGSSPREAIDATYRFMSVAAGDLPGYEEALRALYKKDEKKFGEFTKDWPKDIREHANHMAAKAFG